jgi:SAM-dependent methyltransferase
MSWTEVDEGWGRKALDYACLFEGQMWPEYLEVLNAVDIRPNERMLDVACGPGLAIRLARARGAEVAGLDASPRLAAVAKARTPDADIRVGDMFALPWPDAGFHVVTSFRGIWGGCEAALAEVARVCRPGGMVGLSFWGNAKKMSAYPLLKLFAEVEVHDADHAKQMAQISYPGVAEQMMVDSGLIPGERWSRSIPLEYPDVDLAARAWAATGPSYLAIRRMSEEGFLTAARAAASELCGSDGGVRFGFDVQFLVGRKPS